MPRKLVVLVLITMLAALTGACNSSGEANPGGGSSGEQASAKPEGPTAVETVQVAYRETAAERTAKTTFEMTMTGPPVDPEGTGDPAPMTMTMTGRGALDFSGKASTMTMRMPGMGAMQMRQVGNVAYMKMPDEFAAQMPGARPWIKMDLDEMYGQSGAGLGQMQGGAASDPTRQLEYLRGVSDSVEKVGTEKVRGVQTTRYAATLDMQKAAADMGGEARKAYEDMLRQTGTRKVPVEVWIDDENRVRRYAMNMNTKVPQNANGAPQGGRMRMQMVAEYHDFGTAVDVQAPPPSQTMDGSQFMAGQQPAVAQ